MGIHWDRLDKRLRAQVEANTAQYERVRPSLATVTSQLQSGIRDIFRSAELTPLFVTARTKSVESFRDKASRMLQPAEPGGAPALEFPDPLREIHDLVGVRVIVSLPHEIREAAALIKRQRSDFDCRADREKDIGSIESGTYGYASRHLIMRTLQNNTVKAYQQALGEPARATGSYLFEVQIRTILSHAWSELEHDIRFKSSDPRAWSPYFDRQFTATAAMLEAVESAFAELHERYETVTGYWDEEGEGAAPLTPRRVREVWQTLLPHVDRKSDDDWGWAAELLAAHGLKTTTELAALLNPETITDVRAALEHRYSPGPDRLLDDLLLWRFGRSHIELTAGDDEHRRESLQRRFRQLETYRLGM
ncbi:GTP pyrophosphokinase [Arthrobacter sulfonylureivorans]|uniref:RelA/SpoT domain-containing protein n=1 Tax=Arthrobacter sulfonylureivorans TaxID=2486855 RepID=A0ABY3WFI1_9MICC|nr:RelA/SpoT domain-containing protein [Arthrobacter sulfonylureivorans]UNK46459.1 RelA/SpoT domain-containing protein [Arthrobacter sulfonylureivorans]